MRKGTAEMSKSSNTPARELYYSTVDKTPSGYRATDICRCGWMSVVEESTYAAAIGGSMRNFTNHEYRGRSVCNKSAAPAMPYRGPYEKRVRRPLSPVSRGSTDLHKLKLDGETPPPPLVYDHRTLVPENDSRQWLACDVLTTLSGPPRVRLRDGLLLFAYFIAFREPEFGEMAGLYHVGAAVKRYMRIREPVWEWLREWLEPVNERGGVTTKGDGFVGTGIRGAPGSDLYIDRIRTAVDGLLERGLLERAPGFTEDPSSWNHYRTKLTESGRALVNETYDNKVYGEIRCIRNDPAARAWPPASSAA